MCALTLFACPLAGPADDPAPAPSAEPAPPPPRATAAGILAGYPTAQEQMLSLATWAAERADCLALTELPGLSGTTGAPLLATLALPGAVPPEKRPSVLVVAGLDGRHLTGVAAAMRLIDRVSSQITGATPSDAALAGLLKRRALLVVPNMNFAAHLAIHEGPLREWATNKTPHDDDRDGLIDEDGPEDLDGDGLISMMRIEDPEGTWRPDEKDKRLMVEARADKGERGGWLLVPEGRDNDGDGGYNEDGPGGTNLSRQWPQKYPWFAADSGEHPLREPAVRALADFVIGRENIALAVELGMAENLWKSPKGKDNPVRRRGFGGGGGGPRKPLEEMDDVDAKYLAEFGRLWRETAGFDKEGEETSTDGGFADWFYFHRGRLALKSRVWSPEMAQAWVKQAEAKKEKEAKSDKAEEGGAKGERAAPAVEKNGSEKEEAVAESGAGEEKGQGRRGKSGKEDDKDDTPEAVKKQRALAEWLDKHAPGRVLEWMPVDGAAFEGRRVEAGGFGPLAAIVPPAALVDDLLTSQAIYMASLVDKLPEVAIVNPRATRLADGTWELRFHVRNEGFLPTVLKHGLRSGEVRPVWAEIDLPNESFLGGRRRTRLEPLAGSGASVEVRAVVAPPAGAASVSVRVTSANAGEATAEIPLADHNGD